MSQWDCMNLLLHVACFYVVPNKQAVGYANYYYLTNSFLSFPMADTIMCKNFWVRIGPNNN